MNGQIDQLVKSLLKKDSIEQCSLQELEQFASRHPYFGAAQLLLTKKLQVENSEQYDEQLQKTFLFFHNPLWVQQLLDDTGKATITRAEKKELRKETEAIAEQKIEQAHIAPVLSQEHVDEIQHQEKTSQPIQEQFTHFPEIKEEPVEIISTTTEKVSIPYGSADILNDNEPGENIETTKEELTEIPDTEAIKENIEELPVASITEVTKEEDKPVEEALLFEPFHTVDYFASQGIKIRDEEKPTDKFGKQLRSFTDWLKTMKRLPVTQIAATVEPLAEKKVEQMAAHSLEEREVVTEAMAEVWEKQGNREKAIAIYNKLSLLEPAKSTYFAAKIEELKK
jgi:hypothetical protein